MTKLIAIATALWLAACGAPAASKLSYTVDASRLATVPLESKQDIARAQQQHELALLARGELDTEARDATVEEDLAAYQASHGYVVSVVANRDAGGAHGTATPDATTTAERAATAKVEFMHARSAWLSALAAWGREHALEAQAALELERARVAQKNGITGVDPATFERQLEDSKRAAATAKATSDGARAKVETKLSAWAEREQQSLDANGLHGPLESARYGAELARLTTENITEHGTHPAPVKAPEPATVTASAEPSSSDDIQTAIDKGIVKVDDTTYTIDKSVVEKVLMNPMAVAKGARVVPAMKDGKPEGFKLYAIKPSSAFARLGLTNGDTLTAINGFELTSADKALEVYTKLRDATELEVEITRRGKPMTLKYTIR